MKSSKLVVNFADIDVLKIILDYIYKEGYCIARENENTIEILTKEEFIKIAKETNK